MFLSTKGIKSISLSACLATACVPVFATAAAASTAGENVEQKNVVSAEKTRILILSDIGNEPDDSQSLVRFLLYSNEFDVEGIVATTSTWLRDKVNTPMIHERIDAYERVLPNLQKHAQGYPSAKSLRDVVRSGRAGFGMAHVGEGKSTDASKLIIQAVDKRDDRPLWITLWGGGVDLAQALHDVKAERTPQEVDAFISKIRVYAISDQDNTGAWIRGNFPQLRYITSIHAWNEYFLSTWIGMSSSRAVGGDMSKVNNDWLAENIRRKGPLGAVYPPLEYSMEGDSPSFLYLLRTGLGDPEHPEYGNWGGRYGEISPGSELGLRVSTSDEVVGIDGKKYRTAPATIWRWRDAYQNDFAARMDWTLTGDVKKTNHNPHLVLNGKPGTEIVSWQVKAGESVTLSAHGSGDVDGHAVTYRWWQYKEPTATAMGVHFGPGITLSQPEGGKTSFIAPAVKVPTPFHIILEGTDSGSPALTSYRRAIVTVVPSEK
ncbi:DUF1593 domain-containing protein [Pectobacterium parmentieri]|uniref:DUF1593 domain-containing protein n=1 Tax=Pectobacterium parmentieri TaxID=1905730 RepID=UPI0018DF5B28|nr:DUF1593 domain-containing protein [Pectobacterium parmentieri]MBI0550860.1 DUF1593 domain-containing protein [Pectobacterium parmentieri]MBI0559866.1 DUF1593 domain-containing protein [Pectobacterium parmentieri]MBI0563753.1 DUF1593 domain-containing protein [Pectobacterium parmentieri]